MKLEVSERLYETLNSLSSDLREEVIVDLVGHYNLVGAFQSPTFQDLEEVIALEPETPAPHRAPQEPRAARRARSAASPTKRTRKPRSNTKQQAIMETLSKRTKMDVPKLTKAVYGETTEANEKRLRSLLYALAHQGHVERVDRDVWRSVAA